MAKAGSGSTGVKRCCQELGLSPLCPLPAVRLEGEMKFCPDCDPRFSCCDFCKHYQFNGDEKGRYLDNGMCSIKHERRDPGDNICQEFVCFKLEAS